MLSQYIGSHLADGTCIMDNIANVMNMNWISCGVRINVESVILINVGSSLRIGRNVTWEQSRLVYRGVVKDDYLVIILG